MAHAVKLLSLYRAFALVLACHVAALRVSGDRRCMFPAVYNFGDSNSDTGEASALFSEVVSPNGESFFGRPSGRLCDGRLVIDFIAEELKIPYLSPYLDPLGTDFRHGANFAIAGSSIREGGYSPIHLGIQINQFLRFKSKTTALYNQLNLNGERRASKGKLPRPNEFSKALYIFDIGHNDLASGFQYMSYEKTVASLPYIIGNLSDAIHQVYKAGGRFFWLHNTGPIGCLPYNLIYDQQKPLDLDKHSCVEPQNAVAKEFNKHFKDMISKLRRKHRKGVFTYVDIYKAKYELISRAKELGKLAYLHENDVVIQRRFVDPMEFCCGSYYGYHVDCGKKVTVNGTVYGNPCEDPSRHLSWDGVHYSQAANRLLSSRILDGSLSHPPVSIGEACHIQ